MQIDQPNEVVGCEITTYGNQPNTAGRKERKHISVSQRKETETSRLLAVYGRIQQLRYFGTNSPADMLISSVRSTTF